ncbi:MAG: hypothetical protein FWB91_02930 [Defluviitaleaceae bacterium]|nr:hypothetical protein [Defluviitaleaceae bacterium]
MKTDEDFLKNLAVQYVQEKGEEYQRERIDLENSEDPLHGLDAKMSAALARKKTAPRTVWRGRRIVSIAASVALIIFAATMFFFQSDNFSRADGYVAPSAGAPVTAMPPAPASPPAPGAPPPGAMLPAPETEAPDEMVAPAMPPPVMDAAPPPTVGAGQEYQWDTDRATGDDVWAGGTWEDTIAEAGMWPPSVPEGWRMIYADHSTAVLESGGHTVITRTGLPADDYLPPDSYTRLDIAGTTAFLTEGPIQSILVFERDGQKFTLTTLYDYRDLISLAEYWLLE